MSALFHTADGSARLLAEADLPQLQALFETQPGYFQMANGQPPRPDEAALEFADRPPPELGFRESLFIGGFAPDGRLTVMASVLTHFVAPGVFHIGLFLLDRAAQGQGAAARWHAGLEGWARAQGAQWLRLGVLAANPHAERFWRRLGYQELRRREMEDLAGQPLEVIVMARPLGDAGLDAYLARVARDRPEA